MIQKLAYQERNWQYLALCNAYWWECARIERQLAERLFS